MYLNKRAIAFDFGRLIFSPYELSWVKFQIMIESYLCLF